MIRVTEKVGELLNFAPVAALKKLRENKGRNKQGP